MFAHHVVQDLAFLRPFVSELSDWYYHLSEGIQAATQFHLGQIDKDTILPSYLGKELFQDPNQEIIKLPYRTLWLDWHDNKDKPLINTTQTTMYIKKLGALLCEQSDGSIDIALFQFIHPAQDKQLPKAIWVPLPIIVTLYYSEKVHNFLLDITPFRSNVEEEAKQLADRLPTIIKQSSRELAVINLFLDLVNCKNITTTDNSPPVRLNKKRIKNNKQPLFTYKTLVIKPTGKKQEAQAAQGIWENRIHLCRGHFKTFTKDKPLFGRVTGRYWWQPSVRGNKAKGVITKDYIVNAT